MANPDSNARKTYRELPPGVFVRKRRRQDYFFCYVGHGESRKEVSLGSNMRELALRYEAIVNLSNEVAHRALPSDYHLALYLRSKKNAGTRKIEFSLTEADVIELMRRAKGRCEITGIAFSLEKYSGVRIRPWMPSIDRINASLPYCLDNCRMVCASVNIALNQFGSEMFYKIAYAAVQRRRILRN